jgi:ribonuclease J
MTERELQLQAAALMKEKKHVFVLCSSTNIDRIAAFYHANPFGRYFLCDEYQKTVLDIVKENAGPKSNLYDFQKIVPMAKILRTDFLSAASACLCGAEMTTEKLLKNIRKTRG